VACATDHESRRYEHDGRNPAKEETMTSDHPTDDDRTSTQAPQEALDDLDTETIEDLEVDESDDAENVRGGTSLDCRMH
jgi:hypothetical protein